MKKLEYIQSSGTQWIDTGLTGVFGKVIVDCSVEATPVQWGAITGFTGNYFTGANSLLLTFNQTIRFRYGGDPNMVSMVTPFALHTRYLLEGRSNGEFYVNGNLEATATPATPATDLTIWLFTDHTRGYDTSPVRNATALKLYSAKYYDTSNNLVGDFIPALDDNNVVCLYDKVSKSYFYNRGSGTFTAGPLVASTKYLLESGGDYYTISNNAPLNIGSTLNAQLFRDYGLNDPPAWNYFSTLPSPSILAWSAEDEVELNVITEGTPTYPQVVVSEDIDLTDQSITGIESITATCAGNPVFAVSTDGTTWKSWSGSVWQTLSDPTTGMTASVMADIITSDWNTLIQGASMIKVRFVLFDTTDTVTQVYIDFTN